MSQELIYTSAPRGLKPGSRGFCTVVSTFGMPANLAQRLESLSGYRHVYGPQDAEARLNPVGFSHLLLTVGGRPYHVLSRVADAGLDYSQRTNKLAHHVVLDVSERVPGGPAWLLRQPGFVATAFDGEPRVLQAGRKPPSGNETSGVCHHWARLTGDAGWGGALAEAITFGQKTYIVFRPGMELLPLLAESLALLPPERRWNVTFSTYFTGLPPGIECQVTCVLHGSPEHARIRRTPNALVIDLFSPAGPSPESPYAQAARSGDVAALAGPAMGPAAEQLISEEAFGGLEDALYGLATETASRGDMAAEPPPRGAPTGSPPPLNPSPSGSRPQRQTPIAPRRFRPKEAAKWPYVLLASVTIAILIGIGVSLWWASLGRTDVADHGDKASSITEQPGNSVDEPGEEATEVAKESPPPAAVTPKSDEENDPHDAQNGVGGARETDSTPKQSQQEDDDPAEDTADGSRTPSPPTVPSAAPASPAAPGSEPAPSEAETPKDSGTSGGVAKPSGSSESSETPAAPAASDGKSEESPDTTTPQSTEQPKPVEEASDRLNFLAVGITRKDGQVDDDGYYPIGGPGLVREGDSLKLVGLQAFRPAGREVHFTRENAGVGDGNGSATWKVEADPDIGIGTFELNDKQLRFRWDMESSDAFETLQLRNCLLQVTNSSGQPVTTIVLRLPIRADKVSLITLLEQKPVVLAIESMSDTVLKQLRWQFVPGTNEPSLVKFEPTSIPCGFVVNLTDDESITFGTTVTFRRPESLQASFDSPVSSSPSIKPPWRVSTEPTFSRTEIENLGKKANKEATTLIKNWERDRDQKLPDPASELAEVEALLKDPGRRNSHAQQTLKEMRDQLRKIVEHQSYHDRMDRLAKGWNALERVYVGYQIYLDLDDSNSILLLEGVDAPQRSTNPLPRTK